MEVFISYQRSDNLWAAHLLGYALRAAGHAGFVDTGSIGGGAPYREVIAQAIGRSSAVLALLGPRFDCSRLHEPASEVAYEWQRARFHQLPVLPVLADGAQMPAAQTLPPALRWFTRRNAWALRPATLGPDLDKLLADLPLLARAPRSAARVLWVDDRPANNEHERAALRPHGIVFDSVVSTTEALAQLAQERYDLVITDLGRGQSSDRSGDAGVLFLQQPALRLGGPPVLVYAGAQAVARQHAALLAAGAADATADPQVLVARVLQLLGREPAPAA